jgi:hypothetical protein
MELIAGVALCLALITQLEAPGFVLASLGLLALLGVDHLVAEDRDQGAKNGLGCLVAIMLIAVVAWLIFPAVNSAREAARRSQCQGNLKMLIVALHNYHDVHGHFPPPYVAGPDGKPMHSWRVLILPYIEEQALFQAYNMNEPWNGPGNSKLAARMPRLFRCPSDQEMPPGMTSYFFIAGPGRSMDETGKLPLRDVADGTANTLAVIESSSARVNWLEPRDLTVQDILAGNNTAEAPCACSRHGRSDRGMWRSSGGFNAVLCDGYVKHLPANIDPALMRALMTIDGGEPLEIDALNLTVDEHFWPGTWVLLAAELAFLAAAITRRVRSARKTRTQATATA